MLYAAHSLIVKLTKTLTSFLEVHGFDSLIEGNVMSPTNSNDNYDWASIH